MDLAITPDTILRLGMAHGASKALLSAVELGVFTELAGGELDCDSLTRRLGLHPRGTRDFFDALVALHMLERHDGHYANTQETDLFLDRHKPSYVGDMLELGNERLYADWGELTHALRSGKPQTVIKKSAGIYPDLYSDPERLEQFLKAMTGFSLPAATAIAEQFPWESYQSFVDVGTAQGAFSVQIAQTYPHVSAIGFDLPPVQPYFQKYVAEHGLSERVGFQPGDFFKNALPNADVIVMGHVLHNWNMEEKQLLIARAYQALSKQGVLLVYESLIDDERRKNVQGLLLSLTMLLETRQGFDFTGADCVSWMQAAGFRDVHVELLVGSESMVIGIK